MADPMADPKSDRGASLDPHRIRADFPILQRQVRRRPLVYLDSAATTQKPVSYTHLDVYKRQGSTSAAPDGRRPPRPAGAGSCAPRARNPGSPHCASSVGYGGWRREGSSKRPPVSYTHLDVYKRQGQ